MALNVTVPDRIAKSAARVARAAGVPTETLLIRALEAHFPPVPASLQNEFDLLERASDEDMILVDRLIDNCSNEAR